MKKAYIKSSLIQFSVKNFGCFRDRAEFSMATRKDAQNNFALKQTNDHLLRSSIIYGPNASGKSTLIDAMEFMNFKLRKSWQPEHEDRLNFSPFLMEEGLKNKPVFFEIIFLLDEKIYRYGFSLRSDHTVLTEHLFEIKKDSEKEIFTRNEQNFNVNNVKNIFINDKTIQEKTKEKVLLLTMANILNDKIAENITNFFRFGLNFLRGFETDHLTPFTAEKSKENKDFKRKVLEYLQKADFCISDFQIREKSVPKELISFLQKADNKKLPKKMKTIHFVHKKFDNNGSEIGTVEINMEEESSGTKTFFQEIGLIIEVLESGEILIIDELNAALHPDLLKFIVKLFNSEKTNPKNAQLIFTTHDLVLLSEKNIDRDQFWFTERDKFGKAKLFSLAEFKQRKGSDFQRRYLAGLYGAKPFIDNSIFED